MDLETVWNMTGAGNVLKGMRWGLGFAVGRPEGRGSVCFLDRLWALHLGACACACCLYPGLVPFSAPCRLRTPGLSSSCSVLLNACQFTKLCVFRLENCGRPRVDTAVERK